MTNYTEGRAGVHTVWTDKVSGTFVKCGACGYQWNRTYQISCLSCDADGIEEAASGQGEISHTAGPWHIRQTNSSIVVETVTPASDGFPASIAQVYYPHTRGQTLEQADASGAANARLIAAAPDLLAALQDAQCRLGSIAHLANGENEEIYHLAYDGVARRAIRKAMEVDADA